MYYVVNYDWNDNYGCFTDFSGAIQKYKKLADSNNVIEFFDKNYRRKIVWPKKKMKK